MSDLIVPETDPTLDLVLERVIDVKPELVWEVWTTPEHIKHWFVPKPWSIESCKIDLRPGGIFHSVMKDPEGNLYPNSGCFLEVTPKRRMVWTDALLPGYRPSPEPFFTAMLEILPEGAGTRYIATAMHGNPEKRKQHEEMGFQDGWGTVVTQMVDYIKANLA